MNKRVLYTILSVIMFISGGILLFYFFWANGYIDPPKTAPTVTYSEFTYPSMPSSIEVTTTTTNADTGETQGYVCPVNFEELKAVNPDIVGWIYMTSPYISYPILMSSDDDTFYLSHGATQEYDRNGSLYIESEYNNPDFEDPCTIIYGHRMSDGSMFGNLEASFEDVDLVNDSQYVVIYLAEKSKIYHIIATVPYDSKHILYYNDFSSESDFNEFFDDIYGTSGKGVNLVTEDRPQYGDNILILSTCLRTDRTHRYLIIAKELTN